MANQKITIDFAYVSYHLLSIFIINWFLFGFFPIIQQCNCRLNDMCKSFLMNEYWFFLDISNTWHDVDDWRYESTHIFFEYIFINNHPTNQSITANENKISFKNIHQMLPYSSFWYVHTYIFNWRFLISLFQIRNISHLNYIFFWQRWWQRAAHQGPCWD